MAVTPKLGLERMAAKRAAAMKAVMGAATETGAKGKVAAKLPFFKLLGTKGLGAAVTAHPIQSALGAFFLYQILSKMIGQHAGTLMGQGLQGEQIEAQNTRNPEDMYYQAMLPELAGQKQAAQNALLQAILGGRGMTMPVPGERIIGRE